MSPQDEDNEAIPEPVDAPESSSTSRPRRVTPSTTRPRLSDELEEQLVPIDEKSASGYDEMEDAAARFSRFASNDEACGVVKAPYEVTDSLVHELKGTSGLRRPPSSKP